jgi:ATP-dependent helicase Lhr and Lhr-like helicase
MQKLESFRKWFKARGWKPYSFQEQAWTATYAKKSGLIHVPTGAGKTYAAYIGALGSLLETEPNPSGLRILYITPLKAVSRDIALALQQPIEDLDLNLRVEMRTGDTKASARVKQKKLLPQILVTTPESFSLLLTYPEAEKTFSNVNTVIVDEWHELISTKRGSLLELDLARLRKFSPNVSTWALTATIKNLDVAAQAVVGTDRPYEIIRADLPRPIIIESLLPDEIDTFPWAGHLGLKMIRSLIQWLDPTKSTLIFTNTRSQAERWYQSLREAKPEWLPILALHHGSLAREERERVEAGVKSGEISFVVCTSSLDLGVDFGPVERVVQIGSAKSIARMIQRAGRAGHRPGAPCYLLFVPTNSLELVEITAVRDAIESNEIEPRTPLKKPFDVLVQHLVSRALGGGFTQEQVLSEIQSATSFADLSEHELRWALNFVVHGGESLRAYPNYQKVIERDGRFMVENTRVARLHRLNVGTIMSDASVQLAFPKGKSIGTIDELFISKLKKGDRFLYAGRVLEFLRMKDLKAQVRLARGKPNVMPIWQGGKLPYSHSLSDAVRRTLARIGEDQLYSPELKTVRPVLEAQKQWSIIPNMKTTLAESFRSREGHHFFLYPFEGRLAHEGVAAIIALRLSRRRPQTFSITVNDYGLELLSSEPFQISAEDASTLFSDENLLADILAGMNMTAVAKMQFREIARVACLVLQSYPGAPKSVRQVQVSASLLFDVFQRHDPGNLLIKQAERQVLEGQLELARIRDTFIRMKKSELKIIKVARPTPLGFPLIAERTSARLSSETLSDRLQKMKDQWSRV